MGQLYYQGGHGYPQDFDRAAAYFQEAAGQVRVVLLITRWSYGCGYGESYIFTLTLVSRVDTVVTFVDFFLRWS